MAREAILITSCLSFLLSFIMFLVAFGSPWWYHHGGDASGLWKICYKDNNLWGCKSLKFSDKRGQEKGATVIMCFCLVANVTVLVMYVIDFIKGFSLKIASYVSIGGGVGSLITIIMYATIATSYPYMGWGFFILIGSCILQCITAAITIAAEIKCGSAKSGSDKTSSAKPSSMNVNYHRPHKHDIEA